MTTNETVTLPIPFGTYGATVPQYQLSKDGAIYTTSVGRLGNKQWKGRVWRVPADGGKAEIVFEVPSSLQLFVVRGGLLAVWVDPSEGGNYNARLRVTPIHGYIPPEAALDGTIVSINESQMAQVKQQVAVAQAAAGTAENNSKTAINRAASTANKVAELEKRIAALEARPAGAGGSSGPSTQQVADLVWAKLWDTIYLLRMGMNQGHSSDANIAGWIVDLTAFIRKVK